MKAYRVFGQFLMGRDWQKFSKEIAAEDEASAREVILSDLGSRHRVPRSRIRIIRVREVPPDQVENPVVEFRVKGAP